MKKTIIHLYFLLLFILVTRTAVAANDGFITTWQTTTANESITIPTTGNDYDYTVDWGDETALDIGNTGNATHSYVDAGTYTVTIDETISNGTTRTAKARTDQWNKADTITNTTQPFDIPNVDVAKASSKIQYKLYCVGDIELEEIISLSGIHGFFK